ncbi:MAG: amidohydrolase family protein [Gemmatimonadetes bacterium]|nr:amidohydrolase family protein [Gemmatimonadota bacterium]MYA43245.1 amidohydrolase family protein [Gemmatimonadota bacterium]MYE92172.1 amidohydrolase family protein [Gemmatimonadota bacterium]MYJ10414.1 amidohydrolase family protein [Gemmatimonadota bacterium]
MIWRKCWPASHLIALGAVLSACSPMTPGPEPSAAPVQACYDRATQPQTAVVDSHLHFRAFGGPSLPFDEVMGYLRDTGVRFVNIYGIGQMLPIGSPCTYYLDCPGTPVIPTLKNDFANATDLLTSPPEGVHATLAMTFPDLSRPESVVEGIELLDTEFPGMFRWMGEVNLVKQALFGNAHMAVPLETIREWAPFMSLLRERGIPIAIHSDLGRDEDPTLYLPLIQEVLDLYPDNRVVWMHMGLSLELTTLPADEHIRLVSALLDRHPNLMLDITWRIIDDNYFSRADYQPLYVAFLNEYSDRILPGTDFLASSNKDFEVYRTELEVTSRILQFVDDEAFRNIALGQNYFRLLGLDEEAPAVCGAGAGNPVGPVSARG